MVDKRMKPPTIHRTKILIKFVASEDDGVFEGVSTVEVDCAADVVVAIVAVVVVGGLAIKRN